MITQQANPQVFNPEEFLSKFESFQSFNVSSKGVIPQIGKVESLNSFLLYLYYILELENNIKLDEEKDAEHLSYTDGNTLQYLKIMIANYCYIIEKKDINISKVILTDAEDQLKSTMVQCFQYMSQGTQGFISSSSIQIMLLNVINFVFTMFVTRTKNLKAINNYLNIV